MEEIRQYIKVISCQQIEEHKKNGKAFQYPEEFPDLFRGLTVAQTPFKFRKTGNLFKCHNLVFMLK